jgi:sugar phosphate isomerase/epimerase
VNLPLISLASGILPGSDGPTTARAAVDGGYRAVGFTVDPRIWTDATTREVKAIVADGGIEVLDVEVVIVQPGQARSPESERIIDVGAELGASNVLIVSDDPSVDNTKRAFEHLCRYAEQAGMRAVLEFLMIFEVNSLATALEIVTDVAHPAGGLLIDALHLARCGHTPADLEGLDAHLFPYMQLCDAPSKVAQADPAGYLEDALDARMAPGEAELPLADLLDVLPAGIPLSLEVRSKHYRDTYTNLAARGRAIREQTERFLTGYLSNPPNPRNSRNRKD